ncbi:hypothetical protein LCGC14_0386830 [marine sediment metagenome]|uniref:Phage portal protein n=1 Tax=marine sediment metagenome TaxID=412755 RepID=A0A0F9T0M9_9ZZZZ
MADTKHYLTGYQFVDGKKAIPITDLPPEAWLPMGGQLPEGKVAKYAAEVAYMYRCIDVRAAAVATVPWQIVRGETPIWASDEPEPPVGLQYEWLAGLPPLIPRIEESLSIVSRAYLHLERNGARILELRWLTPSSMKPIWTSDGITQFKRTLGGNQVPIYLPLEDVVYFWLTGASETEPKGSPAAAAMNAAGVLFNVDEFVKQFFERGAIKASILAVPGSTQRKDKLELESWFNRAITGISKAWAAKAINADAVTIIPVGEGLESLSNSSLTTERREEIATAFGIPHAIVMSQIATDAAADADRLNLFDTTIIPECIRIERALNDQLFKPQGLRFQFLPQQLSIYQEDEEQRSEAVLNYVQAGMPLSVAVEVLGITLPADFDRALLDVQPEPEPEQDVTERMEELERFKRWAKRRINSKTFDLMAFNSAILTSADRAAVLAELKAEGGAKGENAPFRATEWADYP